MKKALLLLITVVILTGALWLKVSAAADSSIKATAYFVDFTDVAAGEQVPAKISTSNLSLQNLYCVATEQAGYISCQFPVEYTGQQLTIELSKNKIMYPYTANVPKN